VPGDGAAEGAGRTVGETAGEHRHLLMSVKQLV
jgi:DNA polymerase-3 subunit beta